MPNVQPRYIEHYTLKIKYLNKSLYRYKAVEGFVFL
jgi:hypothetical protein